MSARHPGQSLQRNCTDNDSNDASCCEKPPTSLNKQVNDLATVGKRYQEILQDEDAPSRSQLLSMPYELLYSILDHLLDAGKVSVQSRATGMGYGFDLAVLKVNSQLRDAAAQVLQRKHLIRVVYTGPRHTAPGALFPQILSSECRDYMDVAKTASVGITVSSASPEVVFTERRLVTLRVFEEYISQLAARQAVWVPNSMPGYLPPPDSQNSSILTYRIDVGALQNPACKVSTSSTQCHDQTTRVSSKIFDALTELSSYGDRCEVRFLDSTLPRCSMDSQGYIKRTLALQRRRKDRLDAIVRSGLWKGSLWVSDLVLEYRQLCHDLQLFVCSEWTINEPSYLAAFHEHNREIWELVATTFYTFTSLYYHPAVLETPIMAPLPFECFCGEEVCPCAIVSIQHQPCVSFLEQLLLLSRVPIPLALWNKLEVQIAFLHSVIYKPDDALEQILPCLLHRLVQIRLSLQWAGVKDDPALDHDIAVVRHAVDYGLHPREGTDEGALRQKWYILWCRISFQSEDVQVAPSNAGGIEVCAGQAEQVVTEDSLLGGSREIGEWAVEWKR